LYEKDAKFLICISGCLLGGSGGMGISGRVGGGERENRLFLLVSLIIVILPMIPFFLERKSVFEC
jgi:hypothetical protein